jgi:hypothetical protein
MFKKLLLLSISIAVAITASIYQQITGPEKPYNAELKVSGTLHNFKLPSVYEGDDECLIEIPISDSTIIGHIFYKKYNVNEQWKSLRLIRMNDNLVSIIPYEKPVIKVEYYLEFTSNNQKYYVFKEKPAVVRFQGKIPKIIHYPYVLLIFITLILTVFSAFLALYKLDSHSKYFNLSYLLFAIGTVISAIIFFISMKHLYIAINQYNDLTFYKTLFVYAVFTIAYLANKKKNHIYYPIIVAAILLICYFVPQSVLF